MLTECPACSRTSTIWRPTNCVPPRTSIFMGGIRTPATRPFLWPNLFNRSLCLSPVSSKTVPTSCPDRCFVPQTSIFEEPFDRQRKLSRHFRDRGWHRRSCCLTCQMFCEASPVKKEDSPYFICPRTVGQSDCNQQFAVQVVGRQRKASLRIASGVFPQRLVRGVPCVAFRQLDRDSVRSGPKRPMFL